MTRNPFGPLLNIIIGFFGSIITFTIVVFIMVFFIKLYMATIPFDSSFYYKVFVDFAALIVDFTNPVIDICYIIGILLLGIVYSFTLTKVFKKTA
jgi:hypothetical protein